MDRWRGSSVRGEPDVLYVAFVEHPLDRVRRTLDVDRLDCRSRNHGDPIIGLPWPGRRSMVSARPLRSASCRRAPSIPASKTRARATGFVGNLIGRLAGWRLALGHAYGDPG